MSTFQNREFHTYQHLASLFRQLDTESVTWFDRARQLKQGMMRVLLSGRARLV